MRAPVVAAVLALVAAACSADHVDVVPTVGADQNHRALLEAVAALHAAHHTPAAFRAFADRVLVLRGGMDETVADEAELLVVTEALVVLRAVSTQAVPVETLTLTVWPLGLGPSIAAPVPGEPVADSWSKWMPTAAETSAAYLERLCGGLLARTCRGIVPEGHPEIVGEYVIERYTERARRAVSTCLTCTEPTWAQTVAGWEQLDQAATARSAAAHTAFAPARWPVAGTGSAPRPAAGRDVRWVELPPEARAERVRYALDDARAAGVARIALIAREPAYPFRPRAYVLSTATSRLPVRDGEPVQVLARALDAAATIKKDSSPSAGPRPSR